MKINFFKKFTFYVLRFTFTFTCNLHGNSFLIFRLWGPSQKLLRGKSQIRYMSCVMSAVPLQTVEKVRQSQKQVHGYVIN